MKRFLEWIGVKEKLDTKRYKPPLVSEGDIWWASIGENIGREINGKGKSFSRPVIIFKKLSRNFFFVIPASTELHTGSWYEPYSQNETQAVACLHQSRTIDYQRLSTKLGQLDTGTYLRIQKAFKKLYHL